MLGEPGGKWVEHLNDGLEELDKKLERLGIVYTNKGMKYIPELGAETS